MTTSPGDTPTAIRTGTGPRVLVVDSHPVYRLGLCQLLVERFAADVVGEYGTLAEIHRLDRFPSADLMILESTLTDGDGLSLLARPDRPAHVLVLTSRDEPEIAFRTLTTGATGLITKYQTVPDLLATITQVLAGRTSFPTDVLARFIQRDATPNGLPVFGTNRLSTREKQVYELLGQGMTGKQIAKALEISIHTVDTHRDRIKKKFRLPNGAALIRHAIEWQMKMR